MPTVTQSIGFQPIAQRFQGWESSVKSFLRDLGNDLRKDLNLNINLMINYAKMLL